jgi:co-chaperonin GroES (HSP10)
MPYKLTRDLILVKAPSRAETYTTSFGLILPSDNKSLKAITAEVLAIGPGKHIERIIRKNVDGKDTSVKKKFNYRATVVKPGDKIVFGKSVAREITIEGERYLILPEDTILGIVDE